MSKGAFVYVYGRPGGAAPVKIGRSNALSRRERELRHYLPSSILGGPDGVMLHTLCVATDAAAAQVERAAHKILRGHRVHGSVNPYAYKHSSPLDWFHVDGTAAAAAIRKATRDVKAAENGDGPGARSDLVPTS